MVKITIQYIEQTARDWQAAFATANGKTAPEVTWENGWFVVRGKRYRRLAFEGLIDRLRERCPSPPEGKI